MDWFYSYFGTVIRYHVLLMHIKYHLALIQIWVIMPIFVLHCVLRLHENMDKDFTIQYPENWTLGIKCTWTSNHNNGVDMPRHSDEHLGSNKIFSQINLIYGVPWIENPRTNTIDLVQPEKQHDRGFVYKTTIWEAWQPRMHSMCQQTSGDDKTRWKVRKYSKKSM